MEPINELATITSCCWLWTPVDGGNSTCLTSKVDYPDSVREFFDDWRVWAARSQLPATRTKAQMQKQHLAGLSSYFRQRITNESSERFNSRIQTIKSAAHCFRDFENYRTLVLFHCGKLAMTPTGIGH